jgi:hypothetical protein
MIQKVQDNIIKMSHLPGLVMPADLLTKPLGPTQFIPHASTLLQGKQAYSARHLDKQARQERIEWANCTWTQHYPATHISPTEHKRKIHFPHTHRAYTHYYDPADPVTQINSTTTYIPHK